ncbi:hypothetical protein EDB89DRAFT_2234088 [Lactarius sanguifluus]|nr:hypothetical protein EDB89DRAFT_2234088 [Lactarius sanguifluus]
MFTSPSLQSLQAFRPPIPRDAPTQQPADSVYCDKQGDKNAQRYLTTVSQAVFSSAIRVLGENYGDSSGRLWMMYLSEAEKEDKEIIENWKVDTEGILVFTGLSSATVASFIVESYKQLSPDSSVTTSTSLLEYLRNLPTPPTGHLLRALQRSHSSQQLLPSGQRNAELARRRGAPHKRARMRAYIFYGIKGFKMTRAIEAMPALLHLSVFLFFAGLIDFLIPINTTVAYFNLGWIGLFAAAYAILTILPNLRLNCPYCTPLSGTTWRLS